MRFGMGCSPAETVYVDSHYSVEGRPLIMYLTVLDNSMGYILGKQDEMGRKNMLFIISVRSFLTGSRDILCWKKHVMLWPGRQSGCGNIC